MNHNLTGPSLRHVHTLEINQESAALLIFVTSTSVSWRLQLKAAFINSTEQSGLSSEELWLQKHIFLDASDGTEELLENLSLLSVSHLACMENLMAVSLPPVKTMNWYLVRPPQWNIFLSWIVWKTRWSNRKIIQAWMFTFYFIIETVTVTYLMSNWLIATE